MAFLPRGSAHGLADDPSTPVSEPPTTLAGETSADRPPTVVMLCGAYLLDGSGPHPLLNDLPEVIHLPTRVGRHRELRAAVELLGVELDGDARPGSDTILLTLLDLLLLYIRTSDAPVNTIAQQVGYSSQYTFTHAFKRQYGSPPGGYRHRREDQEAVGHTSPNMRFLSLSGDSSA
ncbi:AraC family transcriptional regulator [Nonomuraea typhae]|uniref:AraC family transcriptional regulator n=1 Tax=Nonomuraea typhae TaxID=2603600 RepID=UPI0012F7F721|nr:cupin domain-containing protein [Nonomuraea typhae]